MTSKTRHDVNKCVMTSKTRNDVQKVRHDVQNTSSRQKSASLLPKHVITSKTRHNVIKCVMTSKTCITSKGRHFVRSTSWTQHIRHDVTSHSPHSPPPPPTPSPLPYLHYICSTMYYLLPPPLPPPPPAPSPHSHYILSTIYYLNMNTSWYNIIMFRVMFHVLHSMADTHKTDKQINRQTKWLQ